MNIFITNPNDTWIKNCVPTNIDIELHNNIEFIIESCTGTSHFVSPS
jgi:hypothetical protein